MSDPFSDDVHLGGEAAVRRERQSIPPTYDHRETGDRFYVETRINDQPLGRTTARDPFVHHRVTIGWKDLLVGALRGKLVVTVIVGGDPQIVDDVIELDADALTFNSSRRREFQGRIQDALSEFGRTGE